MGVMHQGCDMGTMEDAEAALAEKGRRWRELRQPSMDTRAGHRKRQAAEQEARFQLANAAIMWLWHFEQGYCRHGDQCACGGDTAAVRATCPNFVKP